MAESAARSRIHREDGPHQRQRLHDRWGRARGLYRNDGVGVGRCVFAARCLRHDCFRAVSQQPQAPRGSLERRAGVGGSAEARSDGRLCDVAPRRAIAAARGRIPRREQEPGALDQSAAACLDELDAIDRYRTSSVDGAPHGTLERRAHHRVPQRRQHAARARRRSQQGAGGSTRPRCEPFARDPAVVDRGRAVGGRRREPWLAVQLLGHAGAGRITGGGISLQRDLQRDAGRPCACRDARLCRAQHHRVWSWAGTAPVATRSRRRPEGSERRRCIDRPSLWRPQPDGDRTGCAVAGDAHRRRNLRSHSADGGRR